MKKRPKASSPNHECDYCHIEYFRLIRTVNNAPAIIDTQAFATCP
jgi:hypothetical protein